MILSSLSLCKSFHRARIPYKALRSFSTFYKLGVKHTTPGIINITDRLSNEYNREENLYKYCKRAIGLCKLLDKFNEKRVFEILNYFKFFDFGIEKKMEILEECKKLLISNIKEVTNLKLLITTIKICRNENTSLD